MTWLKKNIWIFSTAILLGTNAATIVVGTPSNIGAIETTED